MKNLYKKFNQRTALIFSLIAGLAFIVVAAPSGDPTTSADGNFTYYTSSNSNNKTIVTDPSLTAIGSEGLSWNAKDNLFPSGTITADEDWFNGYYNENGNHKLYIFYNKKEVKSNFNGFEKCLDLKGTAGALAFKVGDINLQIKAHVFGATGRSFVLYRGNSYSSKTQVATLNCDGTKDYIWVVEPDDHTSGDVYWIASGADNSVYLASIEIIDKPIPVLTTITDETTGTSATWGNLGANSLFGNDFFMNNGSAKTAGTPTTTINGTDVNTYNFTSGTDNISFKVNPEGKAGTITVYGESPVNVQQTALSLSSRGDNWGNVTQSGNTFSFPAAWNAISWWYNGSLTNCTNITMTVRDNSLSDSSAPLPWQISVQYMDDSYEDVSTIRGTTFSLDLDGSKAIKQIALQVGNPGSLTFVSGSVTTTTSTSTPTLYSDAECTQVVSTTFPYEFEASNTETTYYVSGGYIGGISVTLHDMDLNLTPITDDLLWYYNGGGGLYGAGRESNGKIYRYVPGYTSGLAVPSSSNTVNINGTNIGGYQSVDVEGTATAQFNTGSYQFEPGTGFAFMLARNKKYRVKIFTRTDDDKLLYKGENALTAESVSDGYVQEIKGGGGATINNYVLTYDITVGDDDETYWILAPAEGLYLGGFEILPVNGDCTADKTLPGVTSLEAGTWTISSAGGNYQGITASTGNKGSDLNLRRYYRLATGSTANAFIWGPSLMENQTAWDIDGDDEAETCVMLNNGNAIGLNIPANMDVTIPFIGDAGSKILVNFGQVISSPTRTMTGTATGGMTDKVTFRTTEATKIWITGESATYVYFPGIVLAESAVGTILNAIDKNYYWFSNDRITDAHKIIAANSWTDGNDETGKTYHYGINTISLTSDANVLVKHQPVKGFNVGNDYIGFKVTKTVLGNTQNSGIINFYYTGNITIKTGTSYTSATNVTPTVTDLSNGTVTSKMATVTFDTSSADQTFWVTGASSFGGYEVLYNNGRGIYVISIFDYNVKKSGVKAISVLQDANDVNSENTSYWQVATTDNRYGTFYGPTRLREKGITDEPIAFGNGNHYGFKLPVSDAKYTISARFRGSSTAGVKILKGATFESATQIATANASSLGTYSTVSVSNQDGGTDDASTYWIAPVGDAIVYLHGYTITSELRAITENHIYKADANLTSGTSLHDNYLMKYSGNGSAYSDATADKMVIVGQSNGSWAFDANDYMGFKVAKGKKGRIRVHYTGGGTLSQDALSLTSLGAGTNASYDADSHTIDFGTESWGVKGWYFGTGTDARDLSDYSGVTIELEHPTQAKYRIVAQDDDGNFIGSDYIPAGATRLDLDLNSALLDGASGTFDKEHVRQIYIQIEVANQTDATKNQITLKSANLVKTPEIKLVAADSESSTSGTQLFGHETVEQGTKVYEYPFDLTNASANQMYWVSGAMKLGAIEIIFDNDHVRVVEWYVNKDTKFIEGSQDPNWKRDAEYDGDRYFEYPEGYDEYATFYVSSGRSARVSFIMPEAVKDVDNWETFIETNCASTASDYKFTEKDTEVFGTSNKNISSSYGKHAIKVDDPSHRWVSESKVWCFDRRNQKKSKDNIGTDGDKNAKGLYTWYEGEVLLPNEENLNRNKDSWATKSHTEYITVTAYQVQKGKNICSGSGGSYSLDASKVDDDNISSNVDYDGKGVWKIYMRFVYLQAPNITGVNVPEGSTDTGGVKTGETITIASGCGGDTYYTINSDEPINQVTETNLKYTQAVTVSQNCVVKAAEYKTTKYKFYDDCADGVGIGTPLNSLKLISRDHFILFKVANSFAILNKDLTDTDYMNKKEGATVMTIPLNTAVAEQTDVNNDQGFAYSANPYAYVTLGSQRVRYYRTIEKASNTWVFNHGGVRWEADNDGGYRTFLDSYKYKFKCVAYDKTGQKDGVNNPLEDDAFKNQTPTGVDGNPKTTENSYTECNGGIGGATTEDGGLFLQPVAGSFFRVEPEYDGIMTLWIRQNGAVDHNTQETGTITRRPVYIVDENGRIMRGSSIVPTDAHHYGINGVYAACSAISEFRSTFEHTWQYGVANVLYPSFGKDFPNRWTTEGTDGNTFKYFYDSKYGVNDYRAAYIMYGRWFNGININATRSLLHGAEHASRYEWTGHQPLYRNNTIYNLEINTLKFENKFAKFGYEVPNFAYVRYRFPVKAGKSYYLGGRGTRTDIVAAQFEPLEANFNTSTISASYRYSDNPTISGYNTDNNQISIEIDDSESSTIENDKTYSLQTALATYGTNGTLSTITMSKSSDENTTKTGGLNSVTPNTIDAANNAYGTTVNVTLNRTFTAGYWHPIVLPFSLSETRVEEIFGEGTQVLYLDPAAHTYNNEVVGTTNYRSAMKPALEGSKLTFTYHHYQMLYANVPAFIRPTFEWTKTYKNAAYDGTEGHKPTVTTNDKGHKQVTSITFKRVTIDKTNLGSDGYASIGYQIGNGYEVVGTYDQTNETGDIYYVNNIETSSEIKTQLVHRPGSSTSDKVTMGATTVWIRPVATNPAPVRITTLGYSDYASEELDIDNESTIIEDIVADHDPIEMYAGDDNVYDTLGRIVGYGTTEGLPKGVYIHQGRKVYIR